MEGKHAASSKTPPRRMQLSLGLGMIVIAVIACGIGGYRHYYLTHVPQVVITYPVGDLLVASAPPGSPKNFAPLVASIQSQVAPRSWQGQGGNGSIRPFLLTDALIVRNHQAAQRQLASFLRKKRAALAGR